MTMKILDNKKNNGNEGLIIPVVFATDENYVPYCGVAISSLIKNTNNINTYEIFVLYDILSSLSIYRLESLSTENVTVNCCCVHEYITNLKVLEHNHLTIASAYRLVMPEIFPQYEKVIYLDSDIVVNADVAELYSINIGANILGAVHGYYKRDEIDFMYNHITETLGIDENNFFNAGVLIVNITEFKKNNVTQKCFKLLSERTDMYFMDQCALNIVCEGKVHILPKRWNHEWLFLFSADNPKLSLHRDEFDEAHNSPAIIHYDGIEKPWDYPEQRLSDYFWKYARQTIFYEEIIYSSQLRRTGELLELLGIIGSYRNIAIYGAGNAGKRYVNKILSMKLCKIVLWVDKNFTEKQGYELPVESVEKLYTTDFDRIFIAIENISISNRVKDILISNNIAREKIIQIQKK
jgi:lipopolysaccharide biosynthesis glycosyltransferase